MRATPRAGFAGLALLLAACANPSNGGSNPFDGNPSGEGRPSPLPYGYREPKGRVERGAAAEQGEELDSISAVVWGEVLTRRRLIRETGGRKEGQDDTAFERELQRRRLAWSKEQLLCKAAETEGLRIVPAVLDDALAREKKRLVEELSKNTGREVTFEEYLAQRQISEDEFRTSVKNRELRMAYLRKLLVGLGTQVRPQVDFTVTPAEVRRLYREQPDLFDEKPAASFALFQLFATEALVGDMSFVEAEKATAERAQQIVAAWQAGEDAASIAARLGLSKRQWSQVDQLVETFQVPVASEWLFAPERRPRDARVFEFPELPGGRVVLCVLEVRAAKKRTFEESYDDVVNAYEMGRQSRLEALKVIELVQGSSVVWPASLADLLVDEARVTLQRLDQDPVLSRARFR
jgi:hypothetical protein